MLVLPKNALTWDLNTFLINSLSCWDLKLDAILAASSLLQMKLYRNSANTANRREARPSGERRAREPNRFSPQFSVVFIDSTLSHFPPSISITSILAMTKEATPPTESAPATTHEAPSLPASPLAKRTKTETDTMTASNAPAVTSIQQHLPPLLVKKLVDSARAPTRGSAFAAGYDIYSAKETVVPAKGKAAIDTGIAIAVPEGTCMDI